MSSSIYFGADFHEAMLILEATPYKSQAHSYTPNEHSPRKMQRLGICDMLMIFSKIAQASMWTILEALSKVSSLNEFLAVLGSHGGSDSWDNKNDVFKGFRVCVWSSFYSLVFIFAQQVDDVDSKDMISGHLYALSCSRRRSHWNGHDGCMISVER